MSFNLLSLEGFVVDRCCIQMTTCEDEFLQKFVSGQALLPVFSLHTLSDFRPALMLLN